MTLPPWHVEPMDNRRAVVEIGGNINGLPLPEEGVYEFVVLWDGCEIFARRLTATKVDFETPPTQQQDEMPPPQIEQP